MPNARLKMVLSWDHHQSGVDRPSSRRTVIHREFLHTQADLAVGSGCSCCRTVGLDCGCHSLRDRFLNPPHLQSKDAGRGDLNRDVGKNYRAVQSEAGDGPESQSATQQCNKTWSVFHDASTKVIGKRRVTNLERRLLATSWSPNSKSRLQSSNQ